MQRQLTIFLEAGNSVTCQSPSQLLSCVPHVSHPLPALSMPPSPTPHPPNPTANFLLGVLRGDTLFYRGEETIYTPKRQIFVRRQKVKLSVGRLNCCLPSPAQQILILVPVGTNDHIFILSKTFTYFEMGPPCRREEGSDP
jgi:hypothetical protein